MPLFSIIIGTYNDWTALGPCLHSLTQQTDGPDFEVIVVDDGSDETAPEVIRQWAECLPLIVMSRPHAGVSSARNYGVQNSHGAILLFADADSRLRPNCLSALASTIATSLAHNYFQLRLVGDGVGIAGRAEALRLMTLQKQLLGSDGCIRYLNTAGFAIRRSAVDINRGVFDPSAIRGEDTLLLAELIQRGELPFFVTEAIVEHHVPLSLMECLRKGIRSALLESRTFDVIASKGIRIRMTHRDRLRMLWSMWKASAEPSIGRSAWFALTMRQSLERATSFIYPLFRSRYDSTEIS
ncbi:MAG: glycosyltransferase family 2 protein [Terriglobales bacterium]|jgi:glycosyltransferase involved in cell wall biosynthesis